MRLSVHTEGKVTTTTVFDKVEHARQRTHRFLAANGGNDVLIVGVGPGNDIEPFEGKHVVGIDPKTPSRFDYTHFERDYETYRFRNNRWDVILMNHVLEHMLNPGVVLAKAYKELKPGGYLGINVPGSPQDKLFYGHLTLWTPHHLTQYLVASGWDCSNAMWFTTPDKDNIGYVVRKISTANPGGSDMRGKEPYWPIPIRPGLAATRDAWAEDRWYE